MNDFDNRAKSWDTEQKIQRARAVATCLKENVDLAGVKLALEYGCGTGLLSFELSDVLPRVVLADSSRGMLDVADGKIAQTGTDHFRTELLDLTATATTTEQSYDLIYTLLTLHHIPDTHAILGTFRDMLTPEGILVIVDLDAEDGSFHGPDVNVHHGFARDNLQKKLMGVGFSQANIVDCYELTRNDRSYSLFLATARK